MNEEQLADLLANHLDALLTGAAHPKTVPEEITQLLPVAQGLVAAAPVPRAEFGVALKESLLSSVSSNKGAMTSSGPVFSHQVLIIIATGLVVLAVVLALLLGTFVFGVIQPDIFGETSPTPPPVPTPLATAQPTPSARPITPAAEPTPTNRTSDSLILPSPTPTAPKVIDILPPMTITVDSREGLPSPLAPGQSSGSDDKNPNSGSSSGGSNSDDSSHDNHDDDD